jgi:hypothetical protein
LKAGEGRISGKMNIHQKIAVAITDIAVLAELCLSLFLANSDLDNFSSLFFRYFFAMMVPTLVLAAVSIRRLGSKESTA